MRPPFKRETLWSRTEYLIPSTTPIPTSITKISSNFKSHFGSTNNKRDFLQILLASWEKCIIEINLKHFQRAFRYHLKDKAEDWLPPKFIKLLYLGLQGNILALNFFFIVSSMNYLHLNRSFCIWLYYNLKAGRLGNGGRPAPGFVCFQSK